MAQHYAQLTKPDNHKYRILAEATRHGHKMWFDVLYYASATGTALDEELGARESYYIRTLNPPLNT